MYNKIENVNMNNSDYIGIFKCKFCFDMFAKTFTMFTIRLGENISVLVPIMNSCYLVDDRALESRTVM